MWLKQFHWEKILSDKKHTHFLFEITLLEGQLCPFHVYNSAPCEHIFKYIIIHHINNNYYSYCAICFNTLRPRQDGCYFADDVLKCIFLNENLWISLKIPLKFVPRGPINNIPALVQIMAWHRPGDKPLSEPMLVFVPTLICVTQPQLVNVHDDIIKWKPFPSYWPGHWWIPHTKGQ